MTDEILATILFPELLNPKELAANLSLEEYDEMIRDPNDPAAWVHRAGIKRTDSTRRVQPKPDHEVAFRNRKVTPTGWFEKE